MLRRSPNAGFSLVEAMIGLVIMAILLMLGFPAFTAWMQNVQIRTATEAIQNGLTLARGEAVRRNTQVSFTMAGPDSTWTVAVVNPPQTVQSRPAADGTRNAQIATSDAVIIFDGLGRTNLAADATIQVTNPTAGACGTGTTDMRCLNVTVAVGGQARMCDPQVTTAGDTRRC
jgi:type IV fimbrial biogenesis protein FimT